jgi:hypothetical protein
VRRRASICTVQISRYSPKRLGRHATSNMPQNEKEPAKDPAAVSLGRRGGMARLRTMTAAERSARARYASIMRWAKVKQVKAKRP